MIAVTVLIAMVCVAGWDADLFDGESKQFGYGYDRALQTYTAVVERATMAGYNELLTARRWGSRWTLAEAKEDIKGQLTFWSDPSELDVNGTFDAWFESGTNGFPTLNTSNILVNAGAATNWFDKTPYFGTVVHSNGWKFADEVLNEMVVAGFDTYHTDKVYPYAYSSETIWGDVYFPMESSYMADTWADAKSLFAANFTDFTSVSYTNMFGITPPYPYAYTASAYYDFEPALYAANAEVRRVKLFLTNAAPHAVEVGIYWRHDIDESYLEHDPYTTGITTNYSVVLQATMQSGDTLETDWIGEWWPTGGDIEWCRAATMDDDYETFYEGYDASWTSGKWHKWHYRFDVTNGFEYVETIPIP